MDTKAFIEDIQNVFRIGTQQGQEYVEVWLTYEDFGGLYFSGEDFELNVKLPYQFESYRDEARKIINLLYFNAKEKLKHIFTIRIYDSTKRKSCGRDDILVYPIKAST